MARSDPVERPGPEWAREYTYPISATARYSISRAYLKSQWYIWRDELVDGRWQLGEEQIGTAHRSLGAAQKAVERLRGAEPRGEG